MLRWPWSAVLIVVAISSVAFPAQSLTHDPYILARVVLTVPEDAQRLADMGMDIIRVERDGSVEMVVHPIQLEQLEGLGFDVQVLIEDMEAHYAQGRKGDNFGAFHTYSETIDELDAIHAAFPQITTAKISLGTSHQGRNIWAIKVSDHPELQEDEPEVLFDGLHHAREVITVEVLLNTLRHLCENYGSDAEITFLVDHRQIWFVPIVNPDGYVYNEETFPAGGGMWRKNRRSNGSGSYGVDLNRNYTYQWGGAGSSGDPNDETYRGPYAGSEPEAQAMMNFIADHQFVTHQSYHSVAGMVLFPWSYTTAHAPDDALLRSMASQMALDNGYQTGQPGEILYRCSGTTTDWSYGYTISKPKAFAFTTEVAGGDFWPPESEIAALCGENLSSDLYLIKSAGFFLDCQDYVAEDSEGGPVDPGDAVEVAVALKNLSPLVAAQGVTAVLRCDDPSVQLIAAEWTIGNISPGSIEENSASPFAFSIETDCPQWHRIPLVLDVVADGDEISVHFDLPVRVGQPTVLYANDFESYSDWIEDPSHSAISGDFVRIDPNPTDYQPGDDATPDPGIFAWITGQNENPGIYDVDGGISATRSPVLDLSGHAGAELGLMYFHGQRDQGDDPQGDFFRIDLSNDGGLTFPVNFISIGDVYTRPTWRSLDVDVDSAIALSDQMIIRVQVSESPLDGDIVEGGIDDVVILAGTGMAPPAPVASFPLEGDTISSAAPVLTVQNVSDPNGDPVTYGFRVYADSLLTEPVAWIDGVSPGSGTTSWQMDPPLAWEGRFWWRAFAADPTERGLACQAVSFQHVYTGPPPVSDLAIQLVNECITLSWTPIAQAVGYVVYRDSLADFEPGADDSLASTSETSYMDCNIEGGQAYYVIRAVDAAGRKSEDSQRVGQFPRECIVEEQR